MTVHITTGNKVDVIQELDENKEFIIVGVQPWGKDFIPLPNPKALAEVILNNLGKNQDGN